MLRIWYLFYFLFVLPKNLVSLAKRQREKELPARETNERVGTFSSFH